MPVEKDAGCIGLQWDENRILRRVALQFADASAAPPAASIKLQYWTGESAWQGQWQPADIAPVKAGNRLTWTFGLQEIPRGTQKVRWLFAGAKKPIELQEISAFSRSRWKAVDVRLESANADSPKKVEIEVYNGVVLGENGKSACHLTWDTAKPLALKVLSSVPQHYKADRTVLRLKTSAAPFGIAIEDLLANDCVYVPHAGVFATREPAPVTLKDYLARISGKQTVLEEVRQSADQDFPKAWAAVHRPIEDLMPTMLSLACDNRKYVVHRGGTVDFEDYDDPEGPQPPLTSSYTPFPPKWRLSPTFGSGQNLGINRRLHGGWLPMPVTKIEDQGISYEQLTYVAPVGDASPDKPAWWRDRALCTVEYKLKNEGAGAAAAHLLLILAGVRDANQAIEYRQVEEGYLATSGGRVLALIDARQAAPLKISRDGKGVLLSGSLPAGVVSQCIVYLPGWKLTAAERSELSATGSGAAKTEEYWKALFAPAMQIDVPDPLLTNIIRSSQACCAIAARNEQGGARVAPWIAATYYGPLESESNSIIRGMGMTGHGDFARRSLDFFLSKCSPEGFITTGYTLVGTGEVLWTLGEQYERTRDRVWLEKVAPQVVRVCDWVIRQRDKTKLLDARGRKTPGYGLMVPGVSADWNRFAFRFFNDAQYYAGLELAGRALKDIGDPAAAKILADAKQYREDILRAYGWMQARTPVMPLGNGTWVPGDPSLVGCFGHVEDFIPGEDAGRTWCYSVEAGAHHLAADRVLDPASREAAWIMDYLEDVQFLRAGWGDYPEQQTRQDVFDLGGFAKLQPYYCRNAEISAMRDDVKPFIRSYFNAIPSLMNAENLSFCEHFHNLGAWNKTHETGWFLCQTAIMFVIERGDELWLAPFVTSHWMNDGQTVSVRNAPMRFGKVSYTINSAAAKGQIEAVVELPAKCSAKKIVLRLRHPEGKPMKSVTVQGKPHADFDPKKETITLEPADGKITVRAQY